MKFRGLKNFIRNLWEQFNTSWDHAAEMQRRIDEGKAEHMCRYLMGGNDHGRIR